MPHGVKPTFMSPAAFAPFEEYEKPCGHAQKENKNGAKDQLRGRTITDTASTRQRGESSSAMRELQTVIRRLSSASI
jgi:hypothetical protein